VLSPRESGPEIEPPSKRTLIDTHGHAARAYGVDSTDTLVLVRPDGYLGCVTTGANIASLEDYLCLVLASPIS
jgi:hypothetical protein